MNGNDSKLLKNRSINQESQNFKLSNSLQQSEHVIEIKENKNDEKNGLIPKPIPTNQLFDFFEELNEASSSTDKKSKYRICIKTMKSNQIVKFIHLLRVFISIQLLIRNYLQQK